MGKQLTTLRADPHERLALQSREPADLSDVPFLKAVYEATPSRQGGLVDPNEMMDGRAVFGGFKWFAKMMIVVWVLVGLGSVLGFVPKPVSVSQAMSSLHCW